MRSGGEADKLAGQYESLWTVRCLTRVLAGEAVALELEPLTDPIGIEFVLHGEAPDQEFHSVKRNAPGRGAWTVAKLCASDPKTGRSVLADLIRRIQMGEQHAAVLVSMSSADVLRNLTDDLRRRVDTIDAFRTRLSHNAGLQRDYARISDLCGGDRPCFEVLSRLYAETISHSQLVALVENTLRSQIGTQTGAFDPSLLWPALWQWLLAERLGRVTTADDVWAYLDQRGFQPHPLAGKSAVLLRQQALDRLEAARSTHGLTRPPFPIRLRLRTSSHEPAVISSDSLPHLLRTSSSIALSGGGGTGKTWLVLATAEGLLRDPSAVPVFVPAAEWATQGGDLVRFASGELAADEPTIIQHAERGVLTWLIDGWNELPIESMREADAHLRTLKRRFPRARCLVTSRSSDTLPSLPGMAEWEALPLSDQERRRLIHDSGVASPQDLAAKIERAPDLDDLTRIPLFLSAAIAITEAGGSLESSAYALLAEFVVVAESRRRIALQDALKGQHRRYLAVLANEMTARGTTRMRRDDAVSVVGRCSADLLAAGVLGQAPDAEAVLQCLVSHHLMRAPASLGEAVGFEHQRFQEWFAADYLERAYSSALDERLTGPNASSLQELLNDQGWNESIVMLAERLRAEERHRDSASLIRLARPVDISLAAAIAGHSSDQAWTNAEAVVRPALMSLWEDPDERVREYALSLMATTRRSVFADIFWQLLASKEGEEMAWACEALAAYGLGVLGEDWHARLHALQPASRAAAIVSIGVRGDPRVALVLVQAVAADDSLPVQAAAIRTLFWQGYVEEAIRWLSRAPSELAFQPDLSSCWEWIPAEALEPAMSWLAAALPHVRSGPDRIAVLSILTELGDPHAASELRAALAQLKTPPKHALNLVGREEHAWMVDVAVERCRLQPDSLERWLPEWLDLAPDQVGRLLDATLHEGFPAHRLNPVMTIAVRNDASGTVERLARIVAMGVAARKGHMHGGSGHPEWDRSVLEEVDLDLRAHAILTAAPEPESADGLAFLLQCLVPWGPKGTVEARALSTEVRSGLRAMALRWLDLITRWPDRTAGLRAELALLIAAVDQGEDTSVILRLIDEDRHDAARVLAETGRRRTNVFTNQYVDALVRIGSESAKQALERLLDDPEYLGDASRGLADYTAAPEGLELWPPRRWARAAEAHRAAAGRVCRRHPDGERIEEALTRLLEARSSPHDPPYAHEVAQTIRALARLDAPATYRSIEKVLDNPGADWGVLDALEALAVGGDAVPVDTARRTSGRFVEEFRRTRDQQAWHAVVRAVSVLLFSSEPAQGVSAVRELQSWIGPTYWMCELVERIGLLGTAEANGLVLEWYGDASIQPRCARQLFAALAAHPSSAGDARLIEALSMPPDGRDERSALVAACRKRAETPEFRQALLARTSSSIPEERSVLAEVISWLSGDDVAEAACWLLDDGRPGVAWSCVEDAFEGREPLDSPGTYRPFPKSCARVREQLFQMYVSDGDRSESARRLLIRVERSRLEMGRPDDEPRHPRWSPTSGAPWPEPIGRQMPGDGSRRSAPRAAGPE